MKKRILVLLLAVAMCLVAFGCGDKKGGKTGKVDENGVTLDEITLTFWHIEDERIIRINNTINSKL